MVAHFNSDVSITEVYLHSIQVWQDNLVAYALMHLLGQLTVQSLRSENTFLRWKG